MYPRSSSRSASPSSMLRWWSRYLSRCSVRQRCPCEAVSATASTTQAPAAWRWTVRWRSWRCSAGNGHLAGRGSLGAHRRRLSSSGGGLLSRAMHVLKRRVLTHSHDAGPRGTERQDPGRLQLPKSGSLATPRQRPRRTSCWKSWRRSARSGSSRRSTSNVHRWGSKAWGFSRWA